MHRAWNKGLTKETSDSVRKTSETMRHKKIDNFKQWRDRQIREGKLKSEYAPLTKDGNLAELLGVILGDGNIGQFPRSEVLRIVENGSYSKCVERHAWLVEQVFGKKPHVGKRKESLAVNITIYEKKISKRLGIPTGSKRDLNYKLPRWIASNEEYCKRFLRGLYESDGSYSEHAPTYTYKFIFTNKNKSLLDIVFRLQTKLGFHPHRSRYAIQISRRKEVQMAKNMIKFRHYDR